MGLPGQGELSKMYPIVDTFSAEMAFHILANIPANFTFQELKMYSTYEYTLQKANTPSSCTVKMMSNQSKVLYTTLPFTVNPVTRATTFTLDVRGLVPTSTRGDTAAITCYDIISPAALPEKIDSWITVNGVPSNLQLMPIFEYTQLELVDVLSTLPRRRVTAPTTYHVAFTPKKPVSLVKLYDYAFLSQFFPLDLDACYWATPDGRNTGYALPARLINGMIAVEINLPMRFEAYEQIKLDVMCSYTQPDIEAVYPKKIYMGTDLDEKFAGVYMTKTL